MEFVTARLAGKIHTTVQQLWGVRGV